MPSHRPERLATYLGRIARQSAIDIFRKRRSGKRQGSQYVVSLSELEECVPTSGDGGNPVQASESKLLSGKINEWLATLPIEMRNIFVGRYYYMDSVKVIAANYDLSESKVKVTLMRARNDLKSFLEKEGFTV
jgi:RNA polymerase sigma-70 factor (ECF subfamily)